MVKVQAGLGVVTTDWIRAVGGGFWEDKLKKRHNRLRSQ
jgi:hypothetical protein